MSTLPKKQVPLWRQIQKENFHCLESLADFLELSEENQKKLLKNPRFPINVPRRLAQKMEKNRLEDPLLLQFLPLKEELIPKEGFVADPVEDRKFCQSPKLLQKYRKRALLLTTSACAMHCRFCFRQNFSYEKEEGFEKELQILRNNGSLSEVILSGGDPLSLGNEALEALLTEFAAIPHIQRIRFHTRFPIGIPERIDASFLKILSQSPKQIFFVLHCNHPKELDEEVLRSLQAISRLGVSVLNQAVLLKGVNDAEATLLSLCETLINGGILPYYLHLLDPVEGTAHFAVSEERGVSLCRFLQENLSGFGVPRLVREIPGYLSKTFITSSY